MSALAWCPWCRDDASANGARVSAVAAPRGAGGCALTPWDGGGWECAECGARAPRQAWAQAQRWQEASDAQRARAEAAEAEVARLRAVAKAADELVSCDYCAEVESYSETAPGSHAAAQVAAEAAYNALVRAVDAMREAARPRSA